MFAFFQLLLVAIPKVDIVFSGLRFTIRLTVHASDFNITIEEESRHALVATAREVTVRLIKALGQQLAKFEGESGGPWFESGNGQGRSCSHRSGRNRSSNPNQKTGR